MSISENNKEIELEQGTSKPLKFMGCYLASSSTPAYFGDWSRLSLYKNNDGKYVCHQVDTVVQRAMYMHGMDGDKVSYRTKVCDTDSEVVQFFGQIGAARDIYSRAGIKQEEKKGVGEKEIVYNY